MGASGGAVFKIHIAMIATSLVYIRPGDLCCTLSLFPCFSSTVHCQIKAKLTPGKKDRRIDYIYVNIVAMNTKLV